MSVFKTLFTALILTISTGLYSQSGPPDSQDAQETLPESNPNSDQETEWDVLHLHNTEKPYDGVNKAFGKTTVENSKVSFPSDNDLLGVKFDRYLKRNKADLNKKKIVLLKFLMDKEHNFSSEQKKILLEVAKKNGFKIRFETVKIDWQARRDKLAKAGDEIIDNSVPDEYKNDQDVSIEIKKTKRGFRKFWNDIYETPTRSEVYGGVTKGVITMALTMGAWSSMGMGAGCTVFWVLTAEHILQEIFFGPYIKTYVNFLYKKIKAKTGDLGVAIWGNVQGFVLFSFDKLLIYMANFGTPPWDPTYLAGYMGMATIGGVLGSFMPVGVFKLIQKGYINRSTGMVSMQALDLVMPVEGALLAFDSPYLAWVFGIHQTVKFGVYVAGRLAQQRGTMIMVPSDVYETDEAKSYLNLDAVPNSELFRSSEKTLEFLKDESIPRALKVNFIKYINKIFETDGELIDSSPEFKGVLKDILETTATYLDEEGKTLKAEIELKSKKAGFKAMFLNEDGDFELGYSFKSWSHFWATTDQVRKDSSAVGTLKKKMKMVNTMMATLSSIPYETYGLEISESAQNIIKGNSQIDPDLDGNLVSTDGTIPTKPDNISSITGLTGSSEMSEAEVLETLSARTGSSSTSVEDQLSELMNLWADNDGMLTEVDREICFGDGYDGKSGIYQYVYSNLKGDEAQFFLILSGALFHSSNDVGYFNLCRSELLEISTVYKAFGLTSVESVAYIRKSLKTRPTFKSNLLFVTRFDAGFNSAKIIKK